jgi:phosphatidylglycerol:prolipoprotein diacylglycerol transferase
MDLDMQGITMGPLEIRFYSVMILSGMVAGIILASKEARRLLDDPDHVVNIAVLGAILGLIGARLYHVFDQNEWPRYQANPELIIRIWDGGIGIYGAIAGALLALVLYVRWKRLNLLRWLDLGAPAFLLGQAIGRWGNFFNEELFGPPSTLPWAIPISFGNRPVEHADAERFHPLFLYESLLSLMGVVALVFIWRRFGGRLRQGDILLLYMVWYPSVRFGLEFLRSGNWVQGGVPMAQWLSGALILAAIATLVWRHRRLVLPEQAANAPTAPVHDRRSRAVLRRQRRRAG